MGYVRSLIQRFRRIRRLYRTFRGKCPYCGEKLAWKTRNRTGNILGRTKMCPNRHYGVETRGGGRILIFDNEGDPIDYLFDRNFRVVKDEPADEEDKA